MSTLPLTRSKSSLNQTSFNVWSLTAGKTKLLSPYNLFPLPMESAYKKMCTVLFTKTGKHLNAEKNCTSKSAKGEWLGHSFVLFLLICPQKKDLLSEINFCLLWFLCECFDKSSEKALRGRNQYWDYTNWPINNPWLCSQKHRIKATARGLT